MLDCTVDRLHLLFYAFDMVSVLVFSNTYRLQVSLQGSERESWLYQPDGCAECMAIGSRAAQSIESTRRSIVQAR